MDFNTTTIDLIRHGEPKGGDRFRGSLDDPLSTLGWSQMNKAVGDHRPWQQIIASPLLRCSDFARELSTATETPLHVEPDFREISFGDWEGKKATEIDTQALSLFWSDPTLHAAPNGERLKDFQYRVVSAWQSLIHPHKTLPRLDKNLLLVAHGGTIRIILAHVLQMPLETLFNLQIPYAAISRIAVYHHHQSGPSEQTSNVVFINGCLHHLDTNTEEK